MDKTQEQKKIDFESKLQANTGKTSDDFRSVPAKRGVISAQGIENTSRIEIPEQPKNVVADKVISSTAIPQEQVPQDKTEEPIIADEKVNTLRQDIQDKSQILNELGLSDITTTFNELLGKGAFTQNLEDKAGIDQKTTDLNDIESQLRETDLKFRREREALQDQAGLTSGQKNARLANISRDQARELADLSIIAATRRDDLTTAQALVDRKVELAFEPLEQKLQFQQFLFEENKELFTAAEQRQFDIKMRDEQVQIDKDKFKFQQFENFKLEAMQEVKASGGSNEMLAVMQNATDEKSLMEAGGNLIGQGTRLDMQLKRMNIASKSLDIKQQKKKLEELSNPDSNLDIKPDFQAATFAKRMDDANRILAENERGVGEKIGTIASFGIANREERQKRSQAERNFINALLRKESGAAISPEEFDSAREQYFAKTTDTEEVRKQKEENRNVVFEGMRISSGAAYEYLVNELEAGSPETLLESINVEEVPQDFFADL